jgi:GTP-binding protein EngB required for normal cell division
MLQLVDIPVAPPVQNTPIIRSPSKNKYVMGPISLSEHYSSKHDKHIYIFGDLHDKKSRPCDITKITAQQIHIMYFIDQLIRKNIQNGKKTDVFLEGLPKYVKTNATPDEFDYNKLNWFESELFTVGEKQAQMYKKFSSTFKSDPTLEQRVRNDEELNYIKYLMNHESVPKQHREWIKHIFDENKNTPEEVVSIVKSFIRSLYGRYNYLSDVVRHYQPYLEHTDTTDIYNFNHNARFHTMDIRSVCELFDKNFQQNNIVCALSTLGDKINLWADVLLKFKNVDDSQLIREVDSFLDRSGVTKEVNKVQDPFISTELKKMLNIGKTHVYNLVRDLFILRKDTAPKDIVDLMRSMYANFLIEFMDIYLLARIFKNSDFKNIIIYAGDYHARVYRSFLKRIGVSTIREIHSEKTCINVGAFEPFFEHSGKVKRKILPQPVVNYLFFGNPGSGKSTLVNNLAGKIVSESGISIKRGLTKEVKQVIVDGVGYVDVPGLEDISISRKMEKIVLIRDALQLGDLCKFFFVCTLDSGRFRPADFHAIRFILDIVGDQVPYGLIFNKISPAVYTYKNKIEEMVLTELKENIPHSIYFFMDDDTLDSKPNVITRLPKDFITFIHNVPVYRQFFPGL